MDEKELHRILSEVFGSCFVSPNETDQNLEAANVVDGLFAVARSIEKLADAVASLKERE